MLIRTKVPVSALFDIIDAQLAKDTEALAAYDADIDKLTSSIISRPNSEAEVRGLMQQKLGLEMKVEDSKLKRELLERADKFISGVYVEFEL